MIPHWAIDLTTKQDYKSKELFWSIQELPEKVIPPKIEIENQWAKDITSMSCTRQSAGNAHKIQQFMEYKKHINFSNEDFWQRAWEKDNSIIATGDYIVNWPKQLKDEKRIVWYYQCEWVEEMKAALSKWHMICCGSQYWDWRKVRDEWVYASKKQVQSWHAFLVCWYEDDYFYAINSYGNDNWIFKLPFSEVKNIYRGKFAVIDKRDEKYAEAIKCKEMIRENYNRLKFWQKSMVKILLKSWKTVEYVSKVIQHWLYGKTK